MKKVEVEVRAGEDIKPTLRFTFKIEGKFSYPAETYPSIEFANGLILTPERKIVAHIFPDLLTNLNHSLKAIRKFDIEETELYKLDFLEQFEDQDFWGSSYGISYLDAPTLNFLDHIRKFHLKKDIMLLLGLEFRLIYSTIENKGSNNSPHLHYWVNIDRVFRYETLRIPASDWVHDFAPKLGLGEYIVVEIPKGNEVIKKAWEYVRQAEVSFRNWDDKSVSAHCREAVKIIKDYVGKQIDKGDKRKWEKLKDKINEIFAAVESLSSTGLHETEIAPIRRPDAEFILYLTKLLIRYAEQVVS